MGEGGEEGEKTQNLRKVGKGRIKEGVGEKWEKKKKKKQGGVRVTACTAAGSAGLLLPSSGGFLLNSQFREPQKPSSRAHAAARLTQFGARRGKLEFPRWGPGIASGSRSQRVPIGTGA